MPTPKQVLADPKFYQLPETEQQKVLARIDPNFMGLPASERSKVLAMGKARLAQTPEQAATLHAKAGYTTSQGAPVPDPTFTSRLAETVGIPTSTEQLRSMFTPTPLSFLEHLAAGPAAPVADQITRGLTQPMTPEERQDMAQHPVGQVINQVAKRTLEGPLAPVGGQGVSNIATDISKGNYPAAAGDVGGTILNLLALREHPTKTTEKLVAATDAMPKDVRRAIPDIATEVRRSGRPEGVGQLGDRIDRAERLLNQEASGLLGPHANVTLPPTANGTWPISDRIRSLITSNMPETERGKAARDYIIARASEFERPWTLGKLDRERIDANNRLNAYYRKGETAQYAAEGSNVGTAVDKAIADAVRDHVYPYVDQLTGKPQGYFRNIKQRIGSLMNMSSDLKSFSEKAEKQSMKNASKSPLENIRLRGLIGERGVPRFYLSEPLEGKDPLKAANKAASTAFPGPIRKGVEAAKSAYVYSYPLREEAARQRAQQLVQMLAGVQ